MRTSLFYFQMINNSLTGNVAIKDVNVLTLNSARDVVQSILCLALTFVLKGDLQLTQLQKVRYLKYDCYSPMIILLLKVKKQNICKFEFHYIYNVDECPKTHKYVYSNGEWCCQTNKDCNDNDLKMDSQCCQYSAYKECPTRKNGQKCSNHPSGKYFLTLFMCMRNFLHVFS